MSLKMARLTQKEAAKQLGISANTLTNYVKGRRVPDAFTIMAIARLTGVRLPWLIALEGHMTHAMERDIWEDPEAVRGIVAETHRALAERLGSEDLLVEYYRHGSYQIIDLCKRYVALEAQVELLKEMLLAFKESR